MNQFLIYHTYFPPSVKDYLEGKKTLKPFYAFPPTLDGLRQAGQNRAADASKGKILAEVLRGQYQTLGISGREVTEAIDALEKGNALTVTTGHQINLMTGPLYTVFKIASTIKLARILQAEFPEKKIIPVYWAATEDHDFEEISSVFINGNTYTWTPPYPVSGAVGRLSTEGLEEFFRQMETHEGKKLSLNRIYRIFRKAWTAQPNLSLAMRKAVHDLFGSEGLICLDPDDARLKTLAVPVFQKELFNQTSFPLIRETSEKLRNLGHKPPAEPREINLFYLKENLRGRIISDGEKWKVLNSEISFSAHELKTELYANPERFSPNVLLRPVYQETILPNIAYIGGPAEIVYWLQLGAVFEAFGVPFPVLIPRDGFLPLPKKIYDQFISAGFSTDDLLLPSVRLLERYVRERIGEKLSTEKESQTIIKLFKGLKDRFSVVGPQSAAVFGASERKILRELEKMSYKAIKLAMKKEKDMHTFLLKRERIVLPGGVPAERKNNPAEFLGAWGPEPIRHLIETCRPLEPGMKIITY